MLGFSAGQMGEEEDLEEAAGALGKWPAGGDDPDLRPLFLGALIALAQNRVPDLPQDGEPADQPIAVGCPSVPFSR